MLKNAIDAFQIHHPSFAAVCAIPQINDFGAELPQGGLSGRDRR